MRRQAIIITATAASDSAIVAEAELWGAFLSSHCGGAWREDEIKKIVGAGRTEVLEAVAGANGLDYSLVVYLGSGKFVKGDVPWAELSMRLAGDETVMERELNAGAVRLAFFFNYSHEVDATGPFTRKQIEFPESKISKAGAREAYECAVSAAEMGLGTILAESAGASWELISATINWCAINGGVLSFPNAVELANSGRKAVEYRGGRRLRHFPLAVGAA